MESMILIFPTYRLISFNYQDIQKINLIYIIFLIFMIRLYQLANELDLHRYMGQENN